MGKTAKILAGIVAVLLFITMGLALFVRLYLTDERIKALVIPPAEKALARKVELGAIKVGLFTGISLNDFVVKEADGATDFIKAEAFVLRYNLLALLKKELAISEIRLDRPYIRIHRDKSGAFNFDSLALLADRTQPKAKQPTDGGALPVALTVDQVGLTKARIVLSDATGALPDAEAVINAQVGLDLTGGLDRLSFQGKADLETTITYGKLQPKLMLKADFDPQKIAYNLDLVLDSESIHLQGEISDYRKTPQVTAHLSAKAINIDTILAAIATLPKPEKTAAAPQSATQGPAESLTKFGLRGTVKIGQIFYQQLSVQDCTAEFDPKQLAFKAAVNTGGETVRIEGQARDYLKTPQITIHVAAKTLNLDSFLAAVAPPAKAEKSPPPKKAGASPLEPLAKYNARGTVKIGQLSWQQLVVQDLDLEFDPQQLRLKAALFASGDTLRLDGTVRNYFKAPQVVMNMSAQQLTVEKLMALTPPKPTGKAAVPAKTPDTPVAQKLPPGLAAEGKVTIDRLLYRQLAVANVALPYKLQDGVLTVNKLTAQLAGGEIASASTLDLRKVDPAFAGDLNVHAVQLNDFLKGLAPSLADTMGGALEAAFTFKGAGFAWERLQKTLNADGSYTLKGAQLSNTPLTQTAAALIGLQELSSLSLDSATGTLKVADGRVALFTQMTGQDVAVQTKGGTIGLDSSLNLPVTLKFSPRLSEKLQQRAALARYLANEANETVVKMRISGTLQKPRPELDPAMVREQAERTIKKKLFEELDKAIGGRQPQQQPPADQPQPQEQQQPSPTQQLLRGILGM